MNIKQYAKAVIAFLSSCVGALTTAVATTPAHSFAQITDLGWLIAAGTVLGVTTAVYAVPNETTASSPAAIADPRTVQLARIEAQMQAMSEQLRTIK